MSDADVSALLERIDVFFGEANAATARVYARLEGDDLPDNCRLAGMVRGPTSRYTRTLSADVLLRDRSQGQSLLAEAVVPDPCFWSPETPYVYDVRVELIVEGRPIGVVHCPLGIRPLGASDGRLWWQGRNWVLRGIDASLVETPADLTAWRATGAAMIVDAPDEALCEEASQAGVLLVARIAGSPTELHRQLKQLSRWPAVGIVLLEPGDEEPLAMRGSAPNLILALVVSEGVSIEPADWAHMLVIPAAGLEQALLSKKLPIAVSALAVPLAHEGGRTLDAMRQACDQLQRNVAASLPPNAPMRDRMAGYLITA